MSNQRTMDEWMFALGIYPSFNAVDRFALFLEMLENYQQHHNEPPIQQLLDNAEKKIEKLSAQKKASFARFIRETDIQAEMKRYRQQQIAWTYLYDADYPASLKEIYIPPVVLFYQGDLTLIAQHTCLGVVGARACTAYGLEAVATIVPDLIEQSAGAVAIVSGLAKGIDTQAHMEAMKAKGQTIAVIGTGLDEFYPRANRALQEQISTEQLLITEYPLGAKPLKFRFPERNRIIAGLSRGILVVEAKQRSGSLITAYNALDENREVFALPGSILEKNSEGCHKLIQLGAVLTQSAVDILMEWSLI